jgi:hypothetical protein
MAKRSYPGVFVLLAGYEFPGADEPFLEPGETYFLSRTRMVPRDEFRALVYMETAEKMVPLAWSPFSP